MKRRLDMTSHVLRTEMRIGAGDRLNFGLAVEQARTEGHKASSH